ncbi:MAG: toxin [Saccharofermentans sp.]|nr:toxin [Saccharofermentans sp.]
MRAGSEYDEIVKEIIPIFIDYDIKSFPLDLERICRLLSVSLIPYSECGPEAKELLLKKTKKGFFVRGTHESTPTIYYNDYEVTVGEMRYTISHEIKHYVYDECNDDNKDDDLADYFARFFLCPIPYLIVKGILTNNDIASHCKVSITAASNAASTIRNRISSFGYKIFDYEYPLLEHLIPEEFKLYKREHYDSETGRWLN